MKVKGIIRKVALALAGLCALGAVGFGVAKLVEFATDDLKTITPAFDVGNLGADGKYVDDESTLYTKEAFECDGLQIKLDFDNQIEYQIYFYDDLDNFIESTEVLSAAYSETVHDGYARIVIMPTNDEDEKISLTERVTYPGQMTIKVAKEQTSEYYQVFNKRLMTVSDVSNLRFLSGSVDKSGETPIFVPSDHSAVTSLDVFDIGSYTKLTFDFDTDEGNFSYFVYEFELNNGVMNYKGFLQPAAESYSVNFSNDTTHIVISCYIWSDSDTYIPFDDVDISILSSHLLFE